MVLLPYPEYVTRDLNQDLIKSSYILCVILRTAVLVNKYDAWLAAGKGQDLGRYYRAGVGGRMDVAASVLK